MENKITLQGLITELAERNFSEGYNEGYEDGRNCFGMLLEPSKALVNFLKEPMNERAEKDLKDIIRHLNEAIARAEGKNLDK